MTFNKAAKPFILKKINAYECAMLEGEYNRAFSYLEDAHVIGQQSTYFHCLIHYKMFKHGLTLRNNIEIFGQALRFIGALTKTAFGLIPIGNTGGANISPFKTLPISKENKVILKKILTAQ